VCYQGFDIPRQYLDVAALLSNLCVTEAECWNKLKKLTKYQFAGTAVIIENLNSNKSTNQMQQSLKCITDVYVQLNMFRASSRPSSGAQQLQ